MKKKKKSLAVTHPKLAKQWLLTKNRDLTPINVTAGSGKKVWWKCDKHNDHEWEAIVNSRANGNGCPCCSGRKATMSNCLAIINPDIAKQWHPTKNNDLTPSDVTSGSNKKVWWKCDKHDGHEWESTIDRRTRGHGCSCCSGHKAVKSNCLSTTHPELATQWDCEKNGDLTPDDVTAGSGKKVWWKCGGGDDHEWKATINSRTSGSGCPYCSGRRL